jgi:hypothetical protein
MAQMAPLKEEMASLRQVYPISVWGCTCSFLLEKIIVATNIDPNIDVRDIKIMIAFSIK